MIIVATYLKHLCIALMVKHIFSVQIKTIFYFSTFQNLYLYFYFSENIVLGKYVHSTLTLRSFSYLPDQTHDAAWKAVSWSHLVEQQQRCETEHKVSC